MSRSALIEPHRASRALPAGRYPDALARHYIFTRSDQDLVVGRRGAANRLGFAVQLALLRHPGIGLAQMEEPIDALVEWLAAQLDIPAAAFAAYADRPQTMTDHALLLARTRLSIRAPRWFALR
jgi:TnpA family transposase